MKEYSKCIHYLTQRKSSCKSKLTNYVKQIPLDTHWITAFLQISTDLFFKFLYFTTLFEQSFNLMFYCPNRCWIYITIYPLQCYNNGTFIETIYFVTTILGFLSLREKLHCNSLEGPQTLKFEAIQFFCLTNIVHYQQATDLKMYQPGHCGL